MQQSADKRLGISRHSSRNNASAADDNKYDHRKKRRRDESDLRLEADDDEIKIDQEALAELMNDEDEEEAESRRLAERKARREVRLEICQKEVTKNAQAIVIYQCDNTREGACFSLGTSFVQQVLTIDFTQVAKHKGIQENHTRKSFPSSPRLVVPIKEAELSKPAIHFQVTELGLAEDRSNADIAFDMFSAEQDQVVVEAQLNLHRDKITSTNKDVFGEEHHANWDDVEGYYVARPGELIGDRYRVLGTVGRGVFSSVLKAVILNENDKSVAVKMIRNNEIMTKAAMKEIQILRMLAEHDPQEKFHCVRLLSTFEHRAHTALVFEHFAMNLRDALNKYGKHVGINIRSVRVYAKQLFLALRHLEKCAIIHADIKPDNILVSENNAHIKLCDFGSAFFVNDPSDPAPYLVSRFYRAPEIILGLRYDRRVDLWSVATCLFEIYTGQVMFPGTDNNDMLRHMQHCKGRFPVKMIRAHLRSYTTLLLRDPHFVQLDGTFKFQRRLFDKRTGEARLTFVDILAPIHSVKDILLETKAGADQIEAVLDLADLLDATLSLNPDNRPQVIDCSKHRFIQGNTGRTKTIAPSDPATSTNINPIPSPPVITTSATTTSFVPAALNRKVSAAAAAGGGATKKKTR